MIDYENWLKGMDDCNAGRPPAMPEDRAYMAGYDKDDSAEEESK